MNSSKLFDEETTKVLREIFSSFKKNLVNYLVLSNDPVKCASCSEARQLANELMSIAGNAVSFKIFEFNEEIREKLLVRYIPAFIYDTRKRNIRYYGIPSGQEFAPFIYVHKYIANNDSTLSKKVIELIEEIDKPLHVKVFVTTECPYCPYVVDAVNQMGIINDFLLVETIEAIEFPDEADIYHIAYVPAVVINKISDWREYGAKPLEIIHGYISPEELAEVLNKISRRLK
ncbi:MAG: thioredoxin family protein [Desulfurococcaceae archaeon]